MHSNYMPIDMDNGNMYMALFRQIGEEVGMDLDKWMIE